MAQGFLNKLEVLMILFKATAKRIARSTIRKLHELHQEYEKVEMLKMLSRHQTPVTDA